MTDYAAAHLLYRAAGWHSPLPLPAGAKWPPPEGYTGWHGLDPSGADCHAWTEEGAYAGTNQLGLRMPVDIIGIDVDHYGIKRGADTIAEAEKRWGPLPLAPYSSARGEGPSGIRLFGVPAGTHLRTVLRFAAVGIEGQPGYRPALGHVEIIQRHHRYAVAWPSVHPDTHDPYLWYGTTAPTAPPRTAAITAKAQLPARWLEELRGSDEPGVAEATPEQVAAFARAHLGATRAGALAGVLKIWEDYTGAGMARHDAMTSVACMAAREAVRGYYPGAQAVAELREAFTQEMAHAKAGQRLVAPGAARAEFAGIWAWAVSQALAESDASRAERAQRAERPSTVFSGGGGGLGFGVGAGQPSHERTGAADHGSASELPEPGGAGTPPGPISEGFEQRHASATPASDDEVRAVFPVKDSETLTHSDAAPPAPTHSDTQSDTPTSAGAPQATAWDEGDGLDENGLTSEQATQVAQNMFEAEVAARARQLKVDRAAKLRVAMELRGDRPSILDELIDVRELDQIKPPSMLMNELVPKASLGFLAGKFGTYKSFIAVAIACCLATGRPFAGSTAFAVESAVPVLYVASEGAAGVAQRVQAWESAHGPIPAGMLKVYPKPIKLNDEVAVAELAAVVESLGVGVVIVDTYHRSAPGTEENNSTEFGLVFEAMAGIRDRYDTTTIFVDHTGKAGVTMRGTSAKEDDADFALIVDLEFTPNDSRGREVQRTLRVRKRKDMPSEGEWDVRLVEVASIGETGSAYIELGSVDRDESAAMFDTVKRPDTWFQADIVMPVQVAEASRTGNGRAAVLDVFRVMSYGYWDGGQTMAEIAAGVRSAEKLGGIRYDPNTVRAAIKNLIGCGIAEPMDPAKPAGRITLAPGYAPPKYR